MPKLLQHRDEESAQELLEALHEVGVGVLRSGDILYVKEDDMEDAANLLVEAGLLDEVDDEGP